MYYPAGNEFFSSSSDSEDDEFYLTPSMQRARGPRHGRTSSSSSKTWDQFSSPAANNNPAQDVKMDSPDLEKILERTKKSVRAVLMACKDQLDLYSLEKEYHEMYEENIPWRQLKFVSLEELLRSIPSVCWVNNIGYSTFVSAVTDENTRHIRQMVTFQKRAKNKGGKGKRRGAGGGGGGRGGGHYNYSQQSYRPPPPATSASLSLSIIKERTEKLLKSTINTRKKPMSFSTLENEFRKYNKEEIPWQRLGYSSLERYLRSLPSVCSVSGSTVSKVSSRPQPAAAPAWPEKVKPSERPPVTGEKSVWLARVRSLLSGRQFGMLLAKLERSYEKDWHESLPLDWRSEAGCEADIVFDDDGVRPVVVKTVPVQQVEPSPPVSVSR